MKLSDRIINWLQQYFKNTNGKKAIIGISGGKDSTVCASLCSKALGNENVIGVIMPNGKQKDINDSKKVCNLLNINTINLNIKNIINIFDKELSEQHIDINNHKQAYINLLPRIRTNLLYTIAQCYEGGRVCNTSNACELFIGWGTFGADTFGDFSPLGNLKISEIQKIGKELDLPMELVFKIPSDGLTNKSDEDNFGFTYRQLELFMNKKYDELDVVTFENIKMKHENNIFKSEIINVPKFTY